MTSQILFANVKMKFFHRAGRTTKVIPRQKWSPKLGGGVQWLYTVQDSLLLHYTLCWWNTSIFDELFGLFTHHWPCKCTEFLYELTVLETVCTSGLKYGHLQIHCFSSWTFTMLCWHVWLAAQITFLTNGCLLDFFWLTTMEVVTPIKSQFKNDMNDDAKVNITQWYYFT